MNHGDIRVENTTGDFDISNVNGGIEMTEVFGSGTAHTVNGGIKVLFAKNPASACSFGTVNGSIETSFRPDLAADVRVKTFNGHAYTDYDMTALPQRKSPLAERRDGKFIYRSDDFNGMRDRQRRSGAEVRHTQRKYSNHQSRKVIMKKLALFITFAAVRGVRPQDTPDRVTVPFSDPSRPKMLKASVLNGSIT